MNAGNITLWIIQGLCALAFLGAGGTKTFLPFAALNKNLPWTKEFPSVLVRLIGIAELLGAIGLIVPAATGILPWLTPTAAAGLIVVMLGAVMFHASRNEWNRIAPSAILLILVAIILIGRLTFAPVVA